MCEPYYEIMLNYIKKNGFLTLNLISQHKHIVNCLIKKDNDCICLEVFYKNHKRYAIFVKLDILSPIDLKNLFRIVEDQPFCLSDFCTTTINDTADLIDSKCFRCAFYNEYKQTIKDSQCAVCLEDNNIFSIELSCNHIFHKDCLKKASDKSCYTHYHCDCPLCRCVLSFDRNMNQVDSCPSSDAFTLDHVDTNDTI